MRADSFNERVTSAFQTSAMDRFADDRYSGPLTPSTDHLRPDPDPDPGLDLTLTLTLTWTLNIT